MGADDYMTKPFSTKELVQQGACAVGLRRPREAGQAIARGDRCGRDRASRHGWRSPASCCGRRSERRSARRLRRCWVERSRRWSCSRGWSRCGLAAFALQRLHRHFVAQPARLLEQAQVLLGTDVQRELAAQGSAENQVLAKTINELARQRAQLRQEIERKVQEASRNIEQERNRLAALMSELSQSVVVCNLNGRMLLYNQRARLLFRNAVADACVGAGRRADRARPLDLHGVRSPARRSCARQHSAAPAARRRRSVDAVRHHHAGRPVAARADGAGARQRKRRAARRELGGFVLMFDNITQTSRKRACATSCCTA